MAGLGKIRVSTETLETASRNVSNLAATYESDYTALYGIIAELKSAWSGTDNTAYTDQIEQFRNDFEAMKALMDDYAEFLSITAETYRTTQENITSSARNLVTNA